jgi:hypothetical protein
MIPLLIFDVFDEKTIIGVKNHYEQQIDSTISSNFKVQSNWEGREEHWSSG